MRYEILDLRIENRVDVKLQHLLFSTVNGV